MRRGSTNNVWASLRGRYEQGCGGVRKIESVPDDRLASLTFIARYQRLPLLLAATSRAQF